MYTRLMYSVHVCRSIKDTPWFSREAEVTVNREGAATRGSEESSTTSQDRLNGDHTEDYTGTVRTAHVCIYYCTCVALFHILHV